MYMYIYHKSFSKHLVVSFKLCLMNAAGVLGVCYETPFPSGGGFRGQWPTENFL